MGERTKIEYTHHTCSPWEGCAKISPACDGCFAAERDRRFHGSKHWGKNAARRMHDDEYFRRPRRWQRAAVRAGERRRVLCGTLCDVFEDYAGDRKTRLAMGAALLALYALIGDTPDLDWLLLTKRPEHVARRVPRAWLDGAWPDNAHIGATVEHPDYAAARLDALCALPAPTRFVSCEPLLGFLDLGPWLPGGGRSVGEAVNWVIAGGETGMRARPTHPEWVLWLREQAWSRAVPFYFKGWGRWLPAKHAWMRTDGGDLYFPLHQGGHGGEKTAYGERYWSAGGHEERQYVGGKMYHELPGAFRREKELS